MPRKPLTEQQKRYIRRATRIAKNTPLKEIARRTGASTGAASRLVWDEKLRSKAEGIRVIQAVQRARLHPSQKKIPAIIADLRQMKDMKGSFTKIAAKNGVSTGFVAEINKRERIIAQGRTGQQHAEHFFFVGIYFFHGRYT